MAATPAAKVCVVAGVGERGIGEHVAARFAKEGYHTAVLARREENLRRIEGDIPLCRGYQCDVSDNASIAGVIARIEEELGAIEVLIVNTSAGPFKPFDETTQEEFDLAMRTGPQALFAFAKAVTPLMRARGRGVIGVTGATASWRGMPTTSAKAPGNFAMRALTQSLARDLGPQGVHVFHMIIDGLVDQPRTHAWLPDKPAQEFLSPAAIADAYWFMASQPRACWGFEMNLVAGPCFGSMATV